MKKKRNYIAWSESLIREIQATAKKKGISDSQELKERKMEKSAAYFFALKRKYDGNPTAKKASKIPKRKYNKRPKFVELQIPEAPKASGRLIMIQGSVEDVTKVLGNLWQ